MLKDRRTYIIGTLIGIVAAAKAMGYISEAVADTLTEILLGTGLITLRAGIKSDSQRTVNAVAAVGTGVGVSANNVQSAAETGLPLKA